MSLEQAPEHYQASDLKAFIGFEFDVLSNALADAIQGPQNHAQLLQYWVFFANAGVQ
jgi:hypothetical protein